MPEGLEQTEAPQDAPSSGYEVIPTSADTPFSPHEAARALAQYRYKRDAREERAATEELSPSESNDKLRGLMAEAGREKFAAEQPIDAPAEQATEAAEPEAVELPAIEPPRSWSKEWKEEFQSYPREVQEKLAQREQERDAGFRRGQNEAAEQRKAIEAELQAIKAERQQTEQLRQLYAAELQNQAGEFADIKTMADVEKLAREDWPRYIQWDAHQKKVTAVQQEWQASQQRAQQEFQSKWEKWAVDEDNKATELIPELANKETSAKFTQGARDILLEDFTEQELADLWNGRSSLSLRDARLQKYIANNVRYRQAKAAVPKAIVKPVPKVQRPGTPTERASDRDVELAALNKKLDSGEASWRDGAEMIIARRGGRR